MRQRRVLITGGAGFIGSHLADALVTRGFAVRVLDNLTPQVHGHGTAWPRHLSRHVELMRADVRDPEAVANALHEVDVVYHLAARVGVGQSMYQVADYVHANDTGTAVLLEAMVERPVQRLIVASSMSVYGEGLYRDPDGLTHNRVRRSAEQLRNGLWEPMDDQKRLLSPCRTNEQKPPDLASVYAMSKYVQEQMALIVGNAYGIPTTALRLFNVYGPRQALSNPYTGVLAIFASRLLHNRPPVVFEDGQQRRDFVSVHDVVQALLQAMEAQHVDGRVINIGSGEPRSIDNIAVQLARIMGKTSISPHITRECRKGDVRHCFADIERAERVLDYVPRVEFEQGLAELCEWVRCEQEAEDRIDRAHAELTERGLTV